MRIGVLKKYLVLLSMLLTGHGAFGQELPIRSGEIVSIEVYGRPDLSGESTLDANGNVNIPLLGRVTAAGRSVEQLEEEIAAALQEAGHAQSPFVAVNIMHRSDVFVDGDVMRPGAYGWRQGMTVRQALALAGGSRRLAEDSLGTVLQAYNAVESYEALQVRLRSLAAKEARHMAELEFADHVLAEDGPETEGLPLSLDISELLPASILPESPTKLSPDQRAALDNYDIAAFRARQREVGTLRLIRFPESVLDDPESTALRRTYETLIADKISTDLASLNVKDLEIQALRERISTLQQREALIGETIKVLQDRLDDILKLRESGLVRTDSVINLQSALSTAMSSQLEILVAISDSRIEIERHMLEISNFAARQRTAASEALESVRTELLAVEARLDTARRAAAVAAVYEGGNDASDIRVTPEVAIFRRENDETMEISANLGDPVLPGDMLVVFNPTDPGVE